MVRRRQWRPGPGDGTHGLAAPATSPRAAKHARSNLSFGARNATPSPTVQTYLEQVEGILQRSAAGRSQLAIAVRSVQPACGTPSPAAVQLTTVVVTRGLLLQQLAALGPGPDPATQVAASLLVQALEASSQADTQYRNWASALMSTASDRCASDPSVAGSLAAAHAPDATATALKSQFVNLFNPLAAQFRLPTWSAADV